MATTRTKKKQPIAQQTGGVGLHIGATEASLRAVFAMVKEIALLAAPSEVRVEALETLRTLGKVENVTVRDCTFSTGTLPRV